MNGIKMKTAPMIDIFLMNNNKYMRAEFELLGKIYHESVFWTHKLVNDFSTIIKIHIRIGNQKRLSVFNSLNSFSHNLIAVAFAEWNG